MRPATPAVMGRNLAVPCGNRRRSQGNDSNAQLAYDRAVDPLWDQPDPEPEPEDEEQEDEDGMGE